MHVQHGDAKATQILIWQNGSKDLPVSICVINDKKGEAFVLVYSRNANISGSRFSLFHFLRNYSRKVGCLQLAKCKCDLCRCHLLSQFFLVVQILILAVQIILHFPKKNLDVQKKFGRPKNFFSSFFHMKLMFWMIKFFFGRPNFFLGDQIFLDSQIFFGRSKLKFGRPK